VTVRTAVAGALGAVVVGQTVLYAVLLGHVERGADTSHAVVLFALSVPLWVLAVVLLARLRLAPRAGVALVLGVGALFSIAALSHPPSTSDDDFRYMWDGAVQLSGTDPYRHPPSAPDLARLRGPRLFGAPGAYPHAIAGGSTAINRPDVRTIYPPVAEAAFTGLRLLSWGGHGNHLPLQLAAVLGSLAVGQLLLRRGPTWRAALWTWSPVVVVEYANNAHIDWLGVLLVVAALAVGTVGASARRTSVIGVLVGAAIAVKLYPALVLPALMRRRWWVAVVAVAFLLLVYVPHVLAVGSDVLGYLPGYLQEEKYGSGERLLLLGPLLGHPFDTVVGVLVMAAVSLWAWLRGDAEHPERAAVVVVGVAFCVFTPSYGWYAGLLLGLVAVTGAVEWLPIVLAPTLAYLVHTDHDTLIYAVALVCAVLVGVLRHRADFRERLGRGPVPERSAAAR
jgi:hypothetical protein